MLFTQSCQILTQNTAKNYQKQQKPPLISKKVQTQLSMDWMYLDSNKYNRQKWAQIFIRMKKCQAKRLILEKNSRSTIIQEISHISFQSLNVLNLKQNNIQNIEALSFVNCPNIEWIFLDNNRITCMKGLIKFDSTNLKKIHLNANMIKQIPMDKVRWSKCFLSLESEISSFEIPSQQDMSFLFKSNCVTIRTYCSRRRIRQKKLCEKIEDRFCYIHLYNAELEMMYNRPIIL